MSGQHEPLPLPMEDGFELPPELAALGAQLTDDARYLAEVYPAEVPEAHEPEAHENESMYLATPPSTSPLSTSWTPSWKVVRVALQRVAALLLVASIAWWAARSADSQPGEGTIAEINTPVLEMNSHSGGWRGHSRPAGMPQFVPVQMLERLDGPELEAVLDVMDERGVASTRVSL